MIYTELHKQHLTLWLPAMLLFIIAATGFYFIPLTGVGKASITLLLIFLTLLMIGIAFLFYYKFAMINCSFTFDEKKLTWDLARKTFIYPQQQQATNWENIAQIARIDDKHHTSYYFTWHKPNFTIILMQAFVAPENDTNWQGLLSHAAKYNIPINQTFYDNTQPPKEIGVLLFMIVLSLFIDVSWYFHQNIGIDKIFIILIINVITIFLLFQKAIKHYRNPKLNLPD